MFNNYYDGNKMIKEVINLYDLLKTVVILTRSGCGGSVVVIVVKCCDAKTAEVIVPQTHRSIGSSLPVFYSQMRWLLDKHVRERRTRTHIHTQDIHTHTSILAIFHWPLLKIFKRWHWLTHAHWNKKWLYADKYTNSQAYRYTNTYTDSRMHIKRWGRQTQTYWQQWSYARKHARIFVTWMILLHYYHMYVYSTHTRKHALTHNRTRVRTHAYTYAHSRVHIFT